MVAMSASTDAHASHLGEDVVGNVRPTPLLPRTRHFRREPVDMAHGIVGQHDAVGVAALTEHPHRLDAVGQRDGPDTEVVETQIGAIALARTASW